MNETLNSKLFNLEDQQMKPEVRIHLLDIAQEFLEQVPEDLDFDILDIRLVGSNAAYNYNPTSDLDIHIVVNLADICKEHPEIVQYLFNAEKQRFNVNYDVTVKGIQAEIYVEDVRAGTSTNGIYSILDDRWIKFPSQPDPSEVVEDISEDEQYLNTRGVVQDVLTNGDSADIKDVINSLYLIRKESLEQDGEYGLGNLIFKEIRKTGLLDKLKSKYYEVRSKELTLESLRRY